MVVADSGVWIDFLRGTVNPATDELARLLGGGGVRLVVPDLVLFEVLRGFRQEHAYRQAQRLMKSVGIEPMGGETLVTAAAQHYRALCHGGTTPRSAIDVLLAAFCIERDYLLLHADRDFDAFEASRGLRAWRH